MVDIVDQLREVKSKDFHPDSLRTMVLWGADEIERLRTTLSIARTMCQQISEVAKIIDRELDR